MYHRIFSNTVQEIGGWTELLVTPVENDEPRAFQTARGSMQETGLPFLFPLVSGGGLLSLSLIHI